MRNTGTSILVDDREVTEHILKYKLPVLLNSKSGDVKGQFSSMGPGWIVRSAI